MTKELLAATYDVKRFQVLQAYKSNPKSVMPALAFAYDKRIAPIDHNSGAKEAYGFDPYEEVYYANSQFVDTVIRRIRELDQAGDTANLSFPRLEDSLGGYKSSRMELAFTVRYLRLSGLFSEAVYKAISDNAPVEAQSIVDDYGPEDVYLD